MSKWTREDTVFVVTNIFSMNLHLIEEIFQRFPILLTIRISGCTILHRSIKRGDLNIFNLAMKYSPKNYLDEPTSDIERVTPLHLAVIYNRGEMVNILINNNVNVNTLDSKNHTALYYAALYLHKDYVLILNTLTDIISEPDLIFTFISASFQDWHQQSKDIISILDILFQKYDINYLDENERTYLYIPVFYGNIAIIKYLIKMGINIYSSDINFKTVIDYAYEIGNPRIIKLLESNE